MTYLKLSNNIHSSSIDDWQKIKIKKNKTEKNMLFKNKKQIAETIKKALELESKEVCGFNGFTVAQESNNLVTRWNGIYVCYGSPYSSNKKNILLNDYNKLVSSLIATMNRIEEFGEEATVNIKN